MISGRFSFSFSDGFEFITAMADSQGEYGVLPLQSCVIGQGRRVTARRDRTIT